MSIKLATNPRTYLISVGILVIIPERRVITLAIKRLRYHALGIQVCSRKSIEIFNAAPNIHNLL